MDKETQEKLKADLDKQLVTPAILLDGLRVVNEGTRKASAYVDPRYVPFYYHLGKYIQPETFLELGFGLGFLSSAFLRSCKNVRHFTGFHERDNTYTPKLGIKNLRGAYRGEAEIYVGQLTDVDFERKLTAHKWDLVFLNEELNYDKLLFELEAVWSNMTLDGYIVMDYVISNKPAAEAYHNFCKIKNREPLVFSTRYGTGVIQK
jgi:predicted O-methyltransferase YrrM